MNAELSAEDVGMYTGLEQPSASPVIKDLLRWRDIKITGEEIHYLTNRKRKV